MGGERLDLARINRNMKIVKPRSNKGRGYMFKLLFQLVKIQFVVFRVYLTLSAPG